MLSIFLVLIVIAIIFVVLNAIGKLPAWPSILVLIILELLQHYK